MVIFKYSVFNFRICPVPKTYASPTEHKDFLCKPQNHSSMTVFLNFIY